MAPTPQELTKPLFRTSAVRLAVIYAILFSALLAATLSFIYWSTRDQIESQVDTRLRLETDILINLYNSGTMSELLEAIQQRNQIDNYGRFYNLELDNTASSSSDGIDENMPFESTRSHTTRNLGDLADLADLPAGSSRAHNPVRIAETKMSNGLTLTIGHEISNEKALLDHTFNLVLGATLLTLLFSLVGGMWIGSIYGLRYTRAGRTGV